MLKKFLQVGVLSFSLFFSSFACSYFAQFEIPDCLNTALDIQNQDLKMIAFLEKGAATGTYTLLAPSGLSNHGQKVSVDLLDQFCADIAEGEGFWFTQVDTKQELIDYILKSIFDDYT